MNRLQFSEEELGATIQRAREIAEQSQTLSVPSSDVEALLSAAEEMGIPRSASLQALKERGLVAEQAWEVDQQVFAPSADGNWYAATLATVDEHTATVRFLGGGERTCPLADLRPFSLVPGMKLEGDLKDWGWWGVVVEGFDTAKGKVRIKHDDWFGEKETLPIQKVRLPGKSVKPETQKGTLAERYRAALIRASLLAGGAGLVLGFVLSQLLR